MRTRPEDRAVSKCLAGRPLTRVVNRESFVPAFDSLRFAKTGTFRDQLGCDLCFVGSYRPEKRALIDSYLAPIYAAQLRIKLFGPEPFGGRPEYLGSVTDETLADLYRSATLCLNIQTPGRMSERAFQIMGLGGSIASNIGWPNVAAERELTPEGFLELVDSWLDSEHAFHQEYDYHLEWRKSLHQHRVAEEHTYFHRVSDIFLEAGMTRESERVLEVRADRPPRG